MRLTVYSSALQHGITEVEIRAVIEYPILRYAIRSRVRPEAETYMFLGGDGDEVWIECAAERIDDGSWHVFHAMLLTTRTAAVAAAVTEGTLVLEPSRTQRC